MEKGKEKIKSTQEESNNGDEDWEWEDLENLPSTYKFLVIDVELIVDYLRPKLNGEELPPNYIHDVDLYDAGNPNCNPDSLAAKYKSLGNSWYFFTPRDRKYFNGTRPDRAAGTGYWKPTVKDKKVFNSSGQQVGTKQTLVFHSSRESKSKTHWLMQEFKLAESLMKKPKASDQSESRLLDKATTSSGPHKKPKRQLNEWVLCRIYKNQKSYGKNKKENSSNGGGEEEEEEEEEAQQMEGENPQNEAVDDHHANLEIGEEGANQMVQEGFPYYGVLDDDHTLMDFDPGEFFDFDRSNPSC